MLQLSYPLGWWALRIDAGCLTLDGAGCCSPGAQRKAANGLLPRPLLQSLRDGTAMEPFPQPTPGTGPQPRDRRALSKRDSRWLEKARVRCDALAEERAVLASRGHMLMCWAIVADITGREAIRHLNVLSEEYRDLTLHAAYGIDEHGEQHRDLSDWAARSIVAVLVFCAHNCMPSELHGRTVWRVAGFTMGFFRMLCSVIVWREGSQWRRVPSRSTFGHVAHKRDSTADPRGWIGDAARVGLLQAFQFDACDVTPQQRGKVKPDGTQWAFIQLFLLVRPWPDGMDGPAPLEKRKTVKLTVRNIGPTVMERLMRKAAQKTAAAHVDPPPTHPILQDHPERLAQLTAAAVEAVSSVSRGSLSIVDQWAAAGRHHTGSDPPPD